MQKKLYKKTSNKMLSGVCAGLAEYFNLDVSLVRVLYVLFSFFTSGFPGLILYIVFAVILPDEETVRAEYEQYYQQYGQQGQPPYGQPPYNQPPSGQPPYGQQNQPPYGQPQGQGGFVQQEQQNEHNQE